MNTLAEAREQGKRDERDRVRAIFAADAAKLNPEAALVFAIHSDIGADAAIRALGKMPAPPPARRGMTHTPPTIKLGPDAAEAPESSYERGAQEMARALGKTGQR